MLKKLIIFLIILFLLLAAGFLFVWREIFLPNSVSSEREAVFSIEKGQGLEEIALNLEKEGLIKDDLFFKIYALYSSRHKAIKAGAYKIKNNLSIPEILSLLVEGKTFKIEVIFLEGFNLKQVEKELSDKLDRKVSLDFTVGEFKKDFDFLSDVPDEELLEGFLFPDTYFFDSAVTDKEITKIFLKNFGEKFNQKFGEEIKSKNKKVFETVIMASLLEKEVRTLEEKKMVSGVLWKRIEIKMPLQVDATLAYLKNGKISIISYEDTKIDSPYNTYKYKGLPKGPIANPGIESLEAALNPKDSDYLYYLSTPEGETIFSRTLEEHNIAKAKYIK